MKRTLTLLTLCSFETMLVIAFATCAALAQETTPTYDIASPPACQNNKGEPVRFENQISPKAESAAGMARRDDKGAPVMYRFAYAKSPQSFQKFIDQCIAENFIFTSICKNDKRKLMLSISPQVVSDFENKFWSQLN